MLEDVIEHDAIELNVGREPFGIEAYDQAVVIRRGLALNARIRVNGPDRQRPPGAAERGAKTTSATADFEQRACLLRDQRDDFLALNVPVLVAFGHWSLDRNVLDCS
jgi:hypothetical protein